jgi:CRP-like cAMP-binding protein
MQRVVCFLIQSAPVNGSETYDIVLHSSKQNIASQLNLAPETFSRALGNLTEKGLIKVKGRTINVLNRQLLGAFSA